MKIALSCVLASLTLAACSHTQAPPSYVCKSNAPHENPSYVATVDSGQTLAADSDNLYFFDLDGLEKIPFAGKTKTTLAPGKTFSYAIAFDDANVYWIDDADSAIDAVPIAGGAVTTIVPKSGGATQLLAANGNAYWVTSSSTGFSIVTANLSNGSLNTLYSTKNVIPDVPGQIILDAQNIYWVEMQSNVSSTIMKMPLGGGAASTVAPTRYAFDLAIVDDEIFWNDNASIFKTPIAGGAVTTVVSGLIQASSLEADSSDNLYFQESVSKGYGLFRASKSGDCVQTMITIDQSSCPAFVLGGGKIFWIDQSSDVIYSAPL